MNSFVKGLLTGLGVGGVIGYVGGVRSAKKAVEELKAEQEELEMYYDEMATKLEERINKLESERENKMKYVDADGEELEVLDDDTILEENGPDYSDTLEKATGKRVVIAQDKVHPMDSEEALELIESHKAKRLEVMLFSDGSLFDVARETVLLDAGKLIGYETLNHLTEDDSEWDGSAIEFPYFVWNENNSIVYEIEKMDQSYADYMETL